MESSRRDVGGLERIESEQVINAQQTRNALPKQFVRLAKLEDTSPSVMNVERLQFRNVTPTLVVNFDDGQEGQRVEILGDGNTTIQNNAKIVTASGADTLLDAAVTYAFTRYTDGKWHQSAGVGGGGGGGGGGVTSFIARTGAVVAVATDYTPAFIGAVPVSHLTDADPHPQYALDSDKGIASGYAPLDGSSKVPLANLPSFTSDVVLISEQVLAAAAASVNFASIPATYRDLLVVVRGRGDKAAFSATINIRFNGDTGANYNFQTGDIRNTNTVEAAESTGQTSGNIGYIAAASATAGRASAVEARIYNYKGTVFQKTVHAHGDLEATSGFLYVTQHCVWWHSTAAINAVLVYPDSGNFIIGTVVSLYGLN